MKTDFIAALDRLRNGIDLTDKELDRLLAWLLSDEGRRQFLSEIDRRWDTVRDAEDAEGADYNTMLAEVHRRIGTAAPASRKPRRYLRVIAEAAAVVALAVGVTTFLRHNEGYPLLAGGERVEVYNPKGLRTSITLPDSTVVILNADSRIAYRRPFARNRRSVELQGEAFFEVAKDTLRPFVVEAGPARMTVLGTSFNVRSYPEDAYISATLVEGSLRVEAGGEKNLLVPGHRATVDKSSERSAVGAADLQAETGWMNGEIYINSMSFREIAALLDRTFNINIRIDNRALLEKRFTGKFEHGESLETILRVLRTSTNFTNDYDRQTNTIIIR